MKKSTQIDRTPELLRTLAEFRFEVRRFLQFSEEAAAEAGLPVQQHQLLLQVAGAPEGTPVTIAYLAERMGLRHHSTVELCDRCEDAGLLRRVSDTVDRRRVLLRLTARGERTLRGLAQAHARELHEMGPRLIAALQEIQSLQSHHEEKNDARR